jgi:hypothetical protein
MLALGFGLAVLFHFLGEARARSFGPAVFLFTPLYGVVCAVPAVFLGILATLPVMTLLTRLLLGRRRFREYLFWDEGRIAARPGVTPDAIIRLLSWLAAVVGVLSAAFVPFALNWHVRFTEEEVIIRRLFALREEAHPYGSVEQVVWTTHVDQGEEVVPRNDVHLRFRDGRTWHMDMNFFRPAGGASLERFLDFLQAKTGKPITRARLIEDVPGW